jgi:DNA-binding transcriptional regulator PaaX
MEDKSPIPGWVSEKEMQSRSGLKTTTLWKLRNDGKLVSSKIGKRVYYKLSSFIELLEKNKI